MEKVCKQVLLRESWSIGWSTIETRNELCLVGFLLVIFLCFLYYSLHTYYLVVIINVTVDLLYDVVGEEVWPQLILWWAVALVVVIQ